MKQREKVERAKQYVTKDKRRMIDQSSCRTAENSESRETKIPRAG